MESCYRLTGESILLAVKALPGAPRSRITGISGGRLRISIAAAPEDGKANAELRAFLAKALGCPRRDIVLAGGEKSRLKTMSLPLACLGKLETLLGSVQ
jgi:uncharacterized protein (TIGR00251 family)